MTKDEIKEFTIKHREDLVDNYNQMVGGKPIASISTLDLVKVLELHQIYLEKLFAALELINEQVSPSPNRE